MNDTPTPPRLSVGEGTAAQVGEAHNWPPNANRANTPPSVGEVSTEGLTEDERESLTDWLEEHKRHHVISNSPYGHVCSTEDLVNAVAVWFKRKMPIAARVDAALVGVQARAERAEAEVKAHLRRCTAWEYRERAKSAESRLKQVEALADEWERQAADSGTGTLFAAPVVDQLRAALADPSQESDND